jgi:hypothetical protein
VFEGEAWTVREETRGHHYDRRARPDLIFESPAIVRRVRDYPENWFDLTDEELMAVSQHR